MRLKDKVIIVTGGTSGIGQAIAERAVAEGARVLVHGIERADGEAVVAKLGAAAALHLDDLVDPASPARIVAATIAAFGRIDAVVNNAAIVARSNLTTTSAANFDRMMAVNVRAPMLLIQAAFSQLKTNEGCVLNIGSINAHSGQANLLDYNVGWVLTAREYAHQIEHGMPTDWPQHVPEQFAPSGRLIRPEEIAAAAVYWLGDESRPVSGAVVELEQYSIIGRNPNKSSPRAS